MQILLFSIVAIFVATWMLQMLKLTRQNRIINSMILKVLLIKMEENNIKVDLSEIEKEILKNL
jgi:hypothetical protein